MPRNFLITLNSTMETNVPFPKTYDLNLASIQGSHVWPNSGHFAVTYRGIRYLKCPFDYVMYQMILEEVKPDLVVEIGTHEGGGALYLADIVSRWGGMVHSIDLAVPEDLNPVVTSHPNIRLFGEGYQGYDVNLMSGFNTILVIDDGSHFAEDVSQAFSKFSPWVSLNSYYIIEDGVIYFEDPSAYGGGPMLATENLLRNNPEFVVDRRWTDMFGTNATFNPNGYLKRISKSGVNSASPKISQTDKPLILITTYIYNPETEEILNRSLDGLLQLGFDVMVVSNSRLQPETLARINFFLYLKEAPYFGSDYTNIPILRFWFGTDEWEINHWLPSYQRYGLSVLRNLSHSLALADSMGYKTFLYLTGDNQFGPKSLEFLGNLPQLCPPGPAQALFYLNGDSEVSSVPIFADIKHFKNLIQEIKLEEDYRNYLIQRQGNLDFLDVEKFFHLNLTSRDPDTYMVRDGLTQLFLDFPDTRWNLVTGVYNTDPKYQGCLTALFAVRDLAGQDLGFSIFSRNLRDSQVERTIEITFEDGRTESLLHSLGTYYWLKSDFQNVAKIRVFEHGSFLFEESWDGASTLIIKI